MFKMSDKLYDFLRWFVGIVLPACATFYAAIAAAWGFPHADEIVASVTILVMFLGALLQMSSAKYALSIAGTGTGNEYDLTYPFKMTGDFYDALKWMVQVALPALSVAYTSMANIWPLPYVNQVSITITSVILLVSTLLQISSAQYSAAKADVETMYADIVY